jgi:hypothetical protein
VGCPHGVLNCGRRGRCMEAPKQRPRLGLGKAGEVVTRRGAVACGRVGPTGEAPAKERPAGRVAHACMMSTCPPTRPTHRLTRPSSRHLAWHGGGSEGAGAAAFPQRGRPTAAHGGDGGGHLLSHQPPLHRADLLLQLPTHQGHRQPDSHVGRRGLVVGRLAGDSWRMRAMV